MGRFEISPTALSGVSKVVRKPIGDERGFLERLWCGDELGALFGERTVAQINRTFTERAGTVRGMHFQVPPYAEDKYVTCVRGRVLDVAVDLRKGSPTLFQWHAEELSADDFTSVMIGPGFAHGFQTLTDRCELVYVHTRPYTPSAERGVNALDPHVAISWPRVIADQSERDKLFPMIDDQFSGVEL